MRGVARVYDVGSWYWLKEAIERFDLPLTIIQGPDLVTGTMVRAYVPKHDISGSSRLLSMCGAVEDQYLVATPVTQSSMRN